MKRTGSDDGRAAGGGGGDDNETGMEGERASGPERSLLGLSF
jgi:hypothetical protein